MKSLASLDQPLLAVSEPDTVLPAVGRRLAAYLSLTKPRLVLMVLVTVAVGYLLGARGHAQPTTLAMTLLGTVAGGRRCRGVESGAGADPGRADETDGRSGTSQRTALRSGGGVLRHPPGGPGHGDPARWVRTDWRPRVSLLTFLLYVFVYTPLKPLTSLNTVIGAIPGALPPMIGWAAATGRLGIEAWALFLIVFLWQFPHFLAIAWIYRDDYRRAGFRMLTAQG